MASHTLVSTPTSQAETTQTTSQEVQHYQRQAEITMALSSLDTHYKEKIADYADTLHQATHQLELLLAQQTHLQEEIHPHTKRSQEIEKEIEYNLRLLERLSTEYKEQAMIIEALQAEQTDSPTLQNRHERLHALDREIVTLELVVLNEELNHQNLLHILEPLQKEARILKEKIKALEAQKHYIESAYLHKLSPTSTPQTQPTIDTPALPLA